MGGCELYLLDIMAQNIDDVRLDEFLQTFDGELNDTEEQDEHEQNTNDPNIRRKIQVQLINALAIMGVKSNTLNDFAQHGKYEEIKELLSNRMSEITSDLHDLGLDEFLKTFDEDLNVTDM